MKTIAVVALAVALLIASATIALASSRTADEVVALPAHGSVWFGSGLAQNGVQIAPLSSFDAAMIARGAAHGPVNVQSPVSAKTPANSFDAAMIARGAAHDPVNVQRADLVQTPVNSFDAAMIARGPVHGWISQRGIVQVVP